MHTGQRRATAIYCLTQVYRFYLQGAWSSTGFLNALEIRDLNKLNLTASGCCQKSEQLGLLNRPKTKQRLLRGKPLGKLNSSSKAIG